MLLLRLHFFWVNHLFKYNTFLSRVKQSRFRQSNR